MTYFAIPVFASWREYSTALLFIGIVFAEVLVVDGDGEADADGRVDVGHGVLLSASGR